MTYKPASHLASDLLRMGLVAAGLLVLWEGINRFGLYRSVLFPPPSSLGRAIREMVGTGEFLADVVASTRRVLIGFSVGSLAGVTIGVLTGRVRLLDVTIGEIVRLLRPIPSIALVPLAIVWLGLGELSKYALVFWGVFFPVWISTHLGASQVDRTIIWAAQSLGATKLKMLYEVVLPSALPFIIAGMRTAIAIAFVVLVAAEMAGAFGGIGYRIYASHLVFRVDKMLVDIILLGILGAVADVVFAAILRAIPWLR